MSGHRPWREVRAELRSAEPLSPREPVTRTYAAELLRGVGEPAAVPRPAPPRTTRRHDHAYDPRLDATHPDYDRDALLARVWRSRWHAVPDDLVGGWAVVTDCDQVAALSELDLVAGERAICDGVLTRGLAAHVAQLHNAALDALPAEPVDDEDNDHRGE